MTANILTSLLFYAGYLGMRTRWQARLFLAIGAGYQWLIYAATDPRTPELWAATVVISLASVFAISRGTVATAGPKTGFCRAVV